MYGSQSANQTKSLAYSNVYEKDKVEQEIDLEIYGIVNFVYIQYFLHLVLIQFHILHLKVWIKQQVLALLKKGIPVELN